MTKRRWTLLFRIEEVDGRRYPVWLYEQLQKHDLNARKRQGWKEIG